MAWLDFDHSEYSGITDGNWVLFFYSKDPHQLLLKQASGFRDQSSVIDTQQSGIPCPTPSLPSSNRPMVGQMFFMATFYYRGTRIPRSLSLPVSIPQQDGFVTI